MMKKIGLVFILVALIVNVGWAQKDPKALAVLDAMSAKYQNIEAFKAKLVYKLENSAEKLNETFRGEITVMGEKYRLKIGEQEIINNGTTIWTYLREVNEVNIDNYYPEDDPMAPSKIYTIYREGYKYSFVEEKKRKGSIVQIIDLEPDNKDEPFYKIRLTIDKVDKTLVNYKVFDKNGNRYLWSVSDFDSDLELTASHFEFDPSKYKDVEIIDLR
jgi:outer membrane lipoprotein-sorting protein